MKLRLHFSAVSEEALQNRALMADVARPFFGLDAIETRQARYAQHWSAFDPNAALEEADIAVLSMDWAYYVRSDRLPEAYDFVARAAQAGVPCAIFCMSDRKSHVRTGPAVLFGSSLYRSRTRQNPQYAVPSFFADMFAGDDEPPLRRKGAKPLIGFCGQATLPTYKLAGVWIRNTIDAIGDRFGQVQYEKPPIRPHILLRNDILQAARTSPLVETNFVIRDTYLGHLGSKGQESRAQRQEFLNNIRDSDYTLCMRGGGNFSKRIYEVLCSGRIPVFVNTDCILPFDFALDWKQYVVWVEQNEIDQLGEKVAAFHDALSDDDFVALQRACRQFWKAWLTFDSFITHFGMHFGLPLSAS